MSREHEQALLDTIKTRLGLLPHVSWSELWNYLLDARFSSGISEVSLCSMRYLSQLLAELTLPLSSDILMVYFGSSLSVVLQSGCADGLEMEDIWNPSADDLLISDNEVRWLVLVTHFEQVQCARFG